MNPTSNKATQFWMTLAIVSTAAFIGAIVVLKTSPKAAPSRSEIDAQTAAPAVVSPVETLTPEHEIGLKILNKLKTATFILEQKHALRDIDSVFVNVEIDDDLLPYIDKTEVRTKLELVLRQNRIKVVSLDDETDDARYPLTLTIEGVASSDSAFAINTTLSLNEFHLIQRRGTYMRKESTTWSNGYYGALGNLVIRETTLERAEILAESFANDYLSVNPE